MLNRPSPRAEAALTDVKAVAADGCVVTHVDYDAMSFASVRAAAKTVLAATPELDVLANNAGVMALQDKATTDGFDLQMQTNHLSHFLLAKELYPAVKAAAAARGEARIVHHSSISRNWPADLPLTADIAAQYLGKNGGNLGGDDPAMGGPRWVRYHYSKLANVCFSLALADKLPAGIKALCAAPGVAATNLQVTSEASGQTGAMHFQKDAQTPEDGAVPLLTCCLSADVKSGEFYEPEHTVRGPAKLTQLEPISLEADRAALWSASEAAIGEKWEL